MSHRRRAREHGPIAVFVAVLAAHVLQAQQRPQFRASVDLLTIDAVVVDADGRHVTDLTAADFELRQSGRTIVPRQAVYVRGAAALPAAAPGAGETPVRDLASLGPSRTTTPAPETVARTIAIVVDDLGLSFESTVAVRAALHRFVEQQIQSGDLVAILRTAGGVGALQQFTMDKRLLRSAADRVLWTPAARAGGAADEGTARSKDSLDEFRSGLLTTGALVTLEAAVAGLQRLPGRNAVVFCSEEFDVFARRSDPRVWSALTRLVDRANRAGVVVYAMDARGLVYVRPGEESRALHERQEGLRYLAGQTGPD